MNNSDILSLVPCARRAPGTTNLSCASRMNPRDIGTDTGDTGDYDAIAHIHAIFYRRRGRLRAHRPLACKVPCFHGSLSPMYRFGVVLPVPHPEAIFKNRGFPTFLLGVLLRESRIPTNSHTTHGRTDTNHENPPFLPHRPQIVGLSNSTAFADNETPVASVDGRKFTRATAGKQKTGAETPVLFVRAEGVEPSRAFAHCHLKTARLPFRHARRQIDKIP